jgi:TetR/AcrR family transcriptional regulator
MGLKQPTNQKEAILEATLRTVAECKLSGTRMRQIAKYAGMSQGNLHYYFPAKQSLITSLLDYMLAFSVAGRAEQLHSEHLSSHQKLQLFLDEKELALRERQDYMLAFYDLWVEATKTPEIREKMIEQYSVWRSDIHEVVQEGVRRGFFDAKAAEHAPGLLVSIMEGAALQFLIDPEVFDLHGHFQAACRMLVDYLTPEPEAESDSQPA